MMGKMPSLMERGHFHWPENIFGFLATTTMMTGEVPADTPELAESPIPTELYCSETEESVTSHKL